MADEDYVELNNDVEIENAENTSSCKGGKSWKKFWCERVNLKWPTCKVYGCARKAILGAHIKSEEFDGMLIIPMCASCNSPYNKDEKYPNQGTRAAIVKEGDYYGLKKHCQ